MTIRNSIEPNNGETALRESNHRIANNLAILSNLLQMRSKSIRKRAESLSPAEAASLLDEVAVRIDSVAKLHRMLSNDVGHAAIGAGPYLSEICARVAASLADDHAVTFDDDSGDLALQPERLNALGLFLAEGLTNALKHSHPASAPGKVEVRFHGDADAIHLAIQDDGVGLPEGFDPSRDGGLGLRIMRALSGQLGAAMSIKANALGVRIGLRVPTPGAATAAAAGPVRESVPAAQR